MIWCAKIWIPSVILQTVTQHYLAHKEYIPANTQDNFTHLRLLNVFLILIDFSLCAQLHMGCHVGWCWQGILIFANQISSNNLSVFYIPKDWLHTYILWVVIRLGFSFFYSSCPISHSCIASAVTCNSSQRIINCMETAYNSCGQIHIRHSLCLSTQGVTTVVVEGGWYDWVH